MLVRALVARAREQTCQSIAIARRLPASWDCEPGAQYVVADLARQNALTDAFEGASVLIHCAAETAGGWAEHQANSINATSKRDSRRCSGRHSPVHSCQQHGGHSRPHAVECGMSETTVLFTASRAKRGRTCGVSSNRRSWHCTWVKSLAWRSRSFDQEL